MPRLIVTGDANCKLGWGARTDLARESSHRDDGSPNGTTCAIFHSSPGDCARHRIGYALCVFEKGECVHKDKCKATYAYSHAADAIESQPDDDDATRFRMWVWRRQHPPSCVESYSLGIHQNTLHAHGTGLGAQLVAMKFGLLDALTHRAIFKFPRSSYSNPATCPSRSFGCYFEPVTNCR